MASRSEAARSAWAKARRIDQRKLARALSSEGVRVVRDYTGPTLELGPLQLYQSAFPERYVVWHPVKELWEIRQLNPVTGEDERYGLVFSWTAFDENGRELPVEVVDEMVAARAMQNLVKLYRAFDYPFVIEKLLEWKAFQAKGARKLSEEMAAHNREVQRKNTAHIANEWEAWEKEDRRWLPVLAGIYDNEGTKNRPYEHERIPQLAVGIDLKE